MEMLYYLGLKALIRNSLGEVLVLEITNGEEIYWDFPGGRVNQGESIAAALRREVLEETGIDRLKIGECLGMELTPIQIPSSEKDRSTGLILSVYVCEAPGLAGIVTEPNARAEWCAPDIAVARNSKFSEPMKQRILAALRSKR